MSKTKLLTIELKNLYYHLKTNQYGLINKNFTDVCVLIDHNKIELHKQVIYFITTYYIYVGDINIDLLLPNLKNVLPEPKTSGKKLRFPLNSIRQHLNNPKYYYLKQVHNRNYDSLSLLLNFHSINGQQHYIKLYYMILDYFEEELAYKIAIKGVKAGAILDSLPVILTN